MTEATETQAPTLLWEGQAAMYASPDGGRVIRYNHADEEKFVAIPPELVPALAMLSANPGALTAISKSPMGGIARRMVKQVTAKAAAGGL